MATAWEIADCEWQDEFQNLDHGDHFLPPSECSVSLEHTASVTAFSFGSFVLALRKQAAFAAAVGKIPHLRAITAELFIGRMNVEIAEDPEVDGRHSIVIRVDVRQSIQEVADRRREWYKMTYQLLGRKCEFVQLAITVVE